MERAATLSNCRAICFDDRTNPRRTDRWLRRGDAYKSSALVDRYADFGHSGSDPGREQFSALIDAIETGQYEYVVVWEISRLARLGSIYQRFFERC